MRYIKNFSKFFLIMIFCLSSITAFAADTKQIINQILAKYGISAGGKEICGQGKEPEYNKDTGIVKCKNDKQGDTNNCWDTNSRLCKECPNGTVVSQKDFITCRQIICPKGFKLVDVKNGKCPKGFKKYEIKNHFCEIGFKSYTEQNATNNYTSISTNCNSIR